MVRENRIHHKMFLSVSEKLLLIEVREKNHQ